MMHARPARQQRSRNRGDRFRRYRARVAAGRRVARVEYGAMLDFLIRCHWPPRPMQPTAARSVMPSRACWKMRHSDDDANSLDNALDFDNGYVTKVGGLTVALTNAEKQKRWRDKRNTLAKLKLPERKFKTKYRDSRKRAVYLVWFFDGPTAAKRLFDQLGLEPGTWPTWVYGFESKR
jgi:hypothetical protein